MKIAYLDCFSGISGDMTVGAFLDAGLKFSVLKKRLAGLGVSGYRLSAKKVMRHNLAGTKFSVLVDKRQILKDVAYSQIRRIITKSRLDTAVKNLAISIFEKLARAEARAHNTSKGRVHFHEIGAVDSIVDIVAAAVAVTELGIREFCCLNLTLGQGNIRARHGNLPLPAPAVLEMLKDKPVSFSDIEYELVTPTGAAILTTLVRDFEARPEIRVARVGYGAGDFNPQGRPNLLRVIIGDGKTASLIHDTVLVIETNMDDMNPVSCEYLIERLFEEGALDAYITPVYMKKTRPGMLLTVLAAAPLLDKLAALIMSETTTSGIRYYTTQRLKLDRQIRTVKTKYGPVRVKFNTGQGGVNTISPEYEDCKALARRLDVPLKSILEEAFIMGRSKQISLQ